MLIAKIKGIVLGCVAVGAVVTGAVVAQDPPPARVDPASPRVVAGAANEGDRDRLQAVEAKLDRILEALGRPRATASTTEARAHDTCLADSRGGDRDDDRGRGPDRAVLRRRARSR